MDIEAEKLLLIEQLIRIRDNSVIEKVKELLRKESNPVVGYKANGSPITQRDFIEMIEQSEKEYKSGNFQNINEVKEESEGW
jgi:hypothetical protein